MADYLMLKAKTLRGDDVYLGHGILGRIFAVEASGENRTSLTVTNQDGDLNEYIVDDSFETVAEKLKDAIEYSPS